LKTFQRDAWDEASLLCGAVNLDPYSIAL
jgi:hypothetical protein